MIWCFLIRCVSIQLIIGLIVSTKNNNVYNILKGLVSILSEDNFTYWSGMGVKDLFTDITIWFITKQWKLKKYVTIFFLLKYTLYATEALFCLPRTCNKWRSVRLLLDLSLKKIDLAIEEKSQIKKKHGVYCTYSENVKYYFNLVK